MSEQCKGGGCSCGDRIGKPIEKEKDRAQKDHCHSAGVSCGHDHGHAHGEKNETRITLMKIGITIAFLIAGVLLEEKGTISLILYLCGYLVIGYRVLLHAVTGLVKGSILDENFLMSIASIGAIAMGEAEEGIFVMLLYTIGSMFEEMAVGKSRRSIEALLAIKPDYANLLEEGGSKEVDPNAVPVGSLILVKPGEKVPIDGIVVSGNSALDSKAVTGESLPVEVKEGSQIYSGSVNISGAITVKTTVLYQESTVARILELTQNAQEKKTKSEQFITKFSKYYTPIVVGLAVGIALLPPLFLGFSQNFSEYLMRALIFLVVSCPCALVISVPLTYFGAIGHFSSKGVLVKGSSYIELLNEIKTVVFDKTGTLTEGDFRIQEIRPAPEVSEEELIQALLTAERNSNHPIAMAILGHYKEQEPFLAAMKAEIVDFQDHAGMGIEAITEKGTIYAGNEKLMQKQGVQKEVLRGVSQEGSLVHVMVNARYLGYVMLGDKVKPKVKETIASLKSAGISTIMLTGDAEKPAGRVAAELGLSNYKASLLPADKVTHVEELKKDSKLMFIGDGINDAPSIMLADIGVAMGEKGSEYAVEISDMVIVDDDISKLPFMFQGAKKTRRIVTQNIVFAIGIKVLVLILSALGMTNMWIAIFADVGVSILAILNALRMLRNEKNETLHI